MTEYDLAGNPLQDANTGSPTTPGPLKAKPISTDYLHPSQGIEFDLAGNPLPKSTASKSSTYGGTAVQRGQNARIAPVHVDTRSGNKGPFTSRKQRPSVANVAAAIVCVAIFAGLSDVLITSIPRVVVPPAKWTTYKGDVLACAQPVGWDVLGSGSALDTAETRTGGVVLSSGPARMEILTEPSANASPPVTREVLTSTKTYASKRPSHALLTLKKSTVASVYNGYQEGTIHDVPAHWGQAALVEWTASGTKYHLPTKLHGYRVAMIGRKRNATVFCECPDSNWPQLKHAFQRVISSVTDSGSSSQRASQIK